MGDSRWESSEYSGEAEEAFAEYVRRTAGGEELDFEAFCAEHPDHEDELQGLRTDWENVRGLVARLELPAGERQAPSSVPSQSSVASRSAVRSRSTVEGAGSGAPRRARWAVVALAFLSLALGLSSVFYARSVEAARRTADELRHARVQTEEELARTRTRAEVLGEEKEVLTREARELEQRADAAQDAAAQALAAREAAEREAREKNRAVLALAARVELDELRTELDGLWPATPARTAEIAAWLARADALAQQLPEHRDRLDELRSSPSQTEDPEGAWWIDQLGALIAGLEELSAPDRGAIARARAGLALAGAILAVQEGRREAWEAARASIADEAQCPMYGGLELEPQLGLAPLGRDPESGLWEFAQIGSGAIPLRDDEGQLILHESSALVLVLVPGGHTALAGGPALDVASFFLAKQPLTAAQWQRIARTPEVSIGELERTELESLFALYGLALPTELEWRHASSNALPDASQATGGIRPARPLDR